MFDRIRQYYERLMPGLSPGDWGALEQCLQLQQFRKGEFLIRNGEVSRTVSFINKGIVRLFYLSDGREICTGFVAENEYVSAYASFLTQTPSAENIEALEDTEVVQLSYTDMQRLYRSHPVYEKFGRKIAESLFIMVSMQTAGLLTLSPEERYRTITEQQPFIIQRVPQYMIASYIGITPEHLSRLRKKRTGK